MSRDGCVALPRGVVDLSAVCDCDSLFPGHGNLLALTYMLQVSILFSIL